MSSTTNRAFFERNIPRPSAASLHALNAVLPAIYAETSLARLPLVFADALARLFPGESHGIVVREFTTGHRFWYLQPRTADGVEPAPGFLSSFRELPVPHPFQFAGASATLALVNVVTRSSLHLFERYQDFPRPLAPGHEFDVELRHREAVICAAVIRHHRDFSSQECGLMNALRPHLQQAWRNAEAFEKITADAALVCAAMPDWNPEPLESRFALTPRESEVLIWVAQGKTNGDVAAILGIRPFTVRTHLERVFAKLGVETRHAATLCALEVLGLHPGTKAAVPVPLGGSLVPLAACA